MDKAILYCNLCDKKWEQSIRYIGDIDWVCPTCGNQNDVFLHELIQDNTNDKPIILGRGGCGKPNS